MPLVTQRLHITPDAFGILDGRDPDTIGGGIGGGIIVMAWDPVPDYLQNPEGTPFSVDISVYLTSSSSDQKTFTLVAGAWPTGWSISSDGTVSYDGTGVGAAIITIRGHQDTEAKDSNTFTVESIAVAEVDTLAPTIPTGVSLVSKTASTINLTCDPPADVSADSAVPYTGMKEVRWFKGATLDGVSAMSAGLSLRLAQTSVSDGTAGGRKLAVGHYTCIPVGHLASDGGLPNGTTVSDNGPVTSDTTAVVVRHHWNILEPTVQGTYSFGKIDKALAQMVTLSANQGANRKILLFVMVETKDFFSTDPSPTYLSAFTSSGVDNFGHTIYEIWRWNATVKAGYQKLVKAIGDAYDSNPYFGGIATQETSVGGSSLLSGSGYTTDSYLQALKDEGAYIAAGCPTSRQLCYINQVSGASQTTPSGGVLGVLAALQPLGAIVGNPDLVSSGGLTTSIYPSFQKYHNGTNGIPAPGPTFSSVQNSEWSANGTPAGQAYMTDLYNYATSSFTYKAADNGTDHTASPLDLDIIIWDHHTAVEAGNHNQSFNPSASRIIHDHPSFGTFTPANNFVAGTLTQSGADYTIASLGAGIGGSSDEWTLGRATIVGDATIVANLAGITGATLTSAFAGLSFRELDAAGSRAVHLIVTPTGITSKYRSLVNSTATTVSTSATPVVTTSCFLKISRATDLFSFYYSLDGLAWTALGSITLVLPSTCFVEIFAGSGTTTSTTASFNQVCIQNLANPTYTFTGLNSSTAYSLTAIARDVQGNDSEPSPPLSVTTSSPAVSAYSLRSLGTVASGTTALVPGMPAGWQAGDLLLLWASTRDNTQTLVTPTGWTLLTPSVNVAFNYLYGRIAVLGDTAPSLDYSATPHSRAQIAAFTGNVYTDLTTIVHASVDQKATSASIVYHNLTVSVANCLVLALGGHNKTATSNGTAVNDIAGFTRLATDTDTGTGLASWWGYQQQTTATSLGIVTQTLTAPAESLQYTSVYIALRTT